MVAQVRISLENLQRFFELPELRLSDGAVCVSASDGDLARACGQMGMVDVPQAVITKAASSNAAVLLAEARFKWDRAPLVCPQACIPIVCGDCNSSLCGVSSLYVQDASCPRPPFSLKKINLAIQSGELIGIVGVVGRYGNISVPLFMKKNCSWQNIYF